MKQRAVSLKKKMKKTGKPLANPTKIRRQKTQISKIRNKKSETQRKSKESSETTLRNYIPINIILKKLINI
jgi:hypothetical protein